jgi:hypothetical protein
LILFRFYFEFSCVVLQQVASRLPLGSEALALVRSVGYAWATDAAAVDQGSQEARRLVLPEAQYSKLRPMLQAARRSLEIQRQEVIRQHEVHGAKLRACVALYLDHTAFRESKIKVGGWVFVSP